MSLPFRARKSSADPQPRTKRALDGADAGVDLKRIAKLSGVVEPQARMGNITSSKPRGMALCDAARDVEPGAPRNAAPSRVLERSGTPVKASATPSMPTHRPAAHTTPARIAAGSAPASSPAHARARMPRPGADATAATPSTLRTPGTALLAADNTSARTLSAASPAPSTPARRTPLGAPGSAARAGLSPLACALPMNYQRLEDTYCALETAVAFLASRGESCTFSTLKGPIERISKREFRLEHLRRLMTALPDALAVRALLAPAASAPSAGSAARHDSAALLAAINAQTLAGGGALSGYEGVDYALEWRHLPDARPAAARTPASHPRGAAGGAAGGGAGAERGAWSQRELVLNSAQGERRRALVRAELLRLATAAAGAPPGTVTAPVADPPMAPLPQLGGAARGAAAHALQPDSADARPDPPRAQLRASGVRRALDSASTLAHDGTAAAAAATPVAVAASGTVAARAVAPGLEGLSAEIIEGVRARQAAREARESARLESTELNHLRALPEVAASVAGCLRASGKRSMPLAHMCRLIAESPLSRRAAYELEPLVRKLAAAVPEWCAVRMPTLSGRSGPIASPPVFALTNMAMSTQAAQVVLRDVLRRAEAALD